MSGGSDPEAIVETLEETLRGDTEQSLIEAGYGIATLSDLGEMFLRAPNGNHFKVTVEAVSADDVEGWGIEFD
jgi:hypothetical protein